MKKSFLYVIVLFLLVLCLVSCNNSQQQQTPDNTKTTETTGNHVHSFSEWKITNEPTCEESGICERTCSCGEKETETIPATGHDIVDGICSKCGYMPETENLYYILINDEYYEVYCGSCQEKVINIPSEHNGKPVLVVKSFSDRDFIEIVNVAEGITTIDKQAFKGCTNLKKVILPDSLTTIDDEAFSESGIHEITIPRGVTEIGNRAFYESELTKFVDQGNFSEIKNSSFMNCKLLKEVILSNNIKEIGTSAFWGCESLESITIPNSVTELGSTVFVECKSLKTLTIPGRIENMGMGIIYKSGVQVVILCEGIKMTSFHSYDDLYLVLEGCDSLESITIPSTVTYMDLTMFERLNIKEVYVEMTKEQWKNMNKALIDGESNCQFVIHCVDGDLDRSEYVK